MKNKLKQMKGITLIALVITIIVLLILAGVSIATLTGENGILTQAQSSKIANKKAEAEEIFKLIANEWQIEKIKTNGRELQIFLGDKEPEYGITATPDEENEGNYILEYKGYQTTINNQGKLVGEISKVEQKPSNSLEQIVIEEAINPLDYGKKVTNYTEKEEETGGWRLFYQDNNYTYLISDNCIGSYLPWDYMDSYPNGSSVSLVGQRLNKSLLDDGTFFVPDNEDENLRTTA